MIDEIIKIEWDFFDKVKNINERASCQNNFKNFEIYRKAQYLTYNNETLESYLNDLKSYQKIGYNPIMLKYARMMESSDNKEYLKIKNKLPPIDNLNQKVINAIVTISLSMKEEFNKSYPNLAKKSRLTYSIDDKTDDTSFETYLKAELSTYSMHTLYCYGNLIKEYALNNQNIIELTQINTVKLFGYNSLKDAEEKLS